MVYRCYTAVPTRASTLPPLLTRVRTLAASVCALILFLSLFLFLFAFPQDSAVFHHPTNPNWHLHVPRFDVQPGQVVAVVGRIGAGKSSLIQAILGNMVKEHGAMRVGGRISYVPQNPWLQNLSVRDNVLFGESYDQSKYDAVIDSCALTMDLQILPQGDESKCVGLGAGGA